MKIGCYDFEGIENLDFLPSLVQLFQASSLVEAKFTYRFYVHDAFISERMNAKEVAPPG